MVPAVAVHVTLVCPLAVNCCVPPRATEAVAGLTVIGEAVLVSVTVAVADWLPVPVALIVTVLDIGMVVGAVYRPEVLMVPAVAVHVTLVCPLAVNCCVPPRATDAVAGLTVIGDAVLVSVTVAVADWLPVPVALIVTVLDIGIVVGAVYRPEVLMVPSVADHVTLVCPLAVNCCVPPKATEAVAGLMVMGEAAGVSVTVAVADWLPVPVALIVTVLDIGIVVGAVYKPDVLMVTA